MSDFKAKMHQNRFLLGLHSRPCWGAYIAPQTPSWNKGDLLLREGVQGGEREERKGRE